MPQLQSSRRGSRGDATADPNARRAGLDQQKSVGVRSVDVDGDSYRRGAAAMRMQSDLVGGHEPPFADGGVAGAGDHVSDAVGDVFGREDLGLPVEEVDHLVA